eukprot:14270-Heterococcus_DN1.PRE.1
MYEGVVNRCVASHSPPRATPKKALRPADMPIRVNFLTISGLCSSNRESDNIKQNIAQHVSTRLLLVKCALRKQCEHELYREQLSAERAAGRWLGIRHCCATMDGVCSDCSMPKQQLFN